MNIDIPIGKLADAIEEYKSLTLIDNQEVDIQDLGCYVHTPTGNTLITHIIKKENLSGIKIVLDNGVEVKCAQHHILQKDRKDIYAIDLLVGDYIETINGDEKVVLIEPITDTTFYDISIDAPHLYYDSDGVLHHNTLITAVLSHSCEHLGRTVVIVPNKDLVTQTERDYRNMGLDVGVLYGDRKEYTKTHTIATWQSIESLMKDNKKGVRVDEMESFIEDIVCIMVDEVHKAKADVLRNQLSSIFSNVPVRWGLTGTVPEAEHEALSCIATLGPVIGQLTSKELQDMGVLSNLDISILQLQDGVLGFSGYAQELKWLVTDPKRMKHISDIINQYAQGGNTLVLIDRLATGDVLASLNPDWAFVSGSTKQKDRQEQYDSISDNDNKVIVATYGVAAVGINIPRIFNLIMLEPGKSYVRVIQSIGRGIRKAQDKDYVNIVDITSNLKYSKRHLTKRKKFYKDQQFPHKVTKIEYK